MLLTKRQYGIFKYLIEHHDIFISSEKLAGAFGVSSRTVKKEIPHIKKYINNFSSFTLDTVPGKGSKIVVFDKEAFMTEVIVVSKNEITITDSEANERDISILKYLLEKMGYVIKEEIMTKFYISESTFYKIYNNIKTILAPFNLSIQHSKSKGYQIIGHEKNKRSLIAKYELIDRHNHLLNFSIDIGYVYNFVADTFIHFQYKVTEPILQNISSHVALMDYRIKRGNYIDTIEKDNLEERIEYQISQIICEKFIRFYPLDERHYENEVLLLTQTILGKINYSVDENMQRKINDFINYCFRSINQKFSINFDSVEKLRLFLVLHMVPLIYRINSGTQLRNLMATEIKQQFPHANDISLYFSLLFKERFGLSIAHDELSYITLYFNFGIEELNLSKSSKRLLVITKLRPSETILLRHKLLTWFPNQISDIQFINPSDEIENLEQFDAVFATELYSQQYANAVTLINVFPDEIDYKRINLAMNGYTSAEAILEKFNAYCFYYGEVSTKEDALKIVCNNAQEHFGLDDDFFEMIQSREEIASTYFGDNVAIPHPLAPITDETFVSVGVLERPIEWDSNHMVQLILLISIEKNNPKAFQLWYYLSDIIRNNDSIKDLLTQKNYDDFISTMNNLLASVI